MITDVISGIKWKKVENLLAGFYGKFQTTMDNKGRFPLPSKLRTIKGSDGKKPLLSGDLVMTKGLEGCLSLYPDGEWNEIQSRLSALSFTQKDFRSFSRRFYSSASVVAPDRSGRILIPAHLIEEADLKKDLLVIGVSRWVEIWNADRFRFYLEQYAGSYEEVAERLFAGDGPQRE